MAIPFILGIADEDKAKGDSTDWCIYGIDQAHHLLAIGCKWMADMKASICKVCPAVATKPHTWL